MPSRTALATGLLALVAANTVGAPALATADDPAHVVTDGSTTTYTDPALAAEDTTRVEGRVEQWVQDDTTGATRHTAVVTDDGRFLPLDDVPALDTDVDRGDDVVARILPASRSGQDDRVARATIRPAAARTAATAHKVYVALPSNLGGFTRTQAQIEAGVDQAVAGWQQETGSSIATFTRAGTRTFTSSKKCGSTDPDVTWTDAEKAFPGVRFDTGANHLVVAVPYKTCETYAGVGTLGAGVEAGGYVLMTWGHGGEQSVLRHEIGHNLGLNHANLRTCTSTCRVAEYQNAYSVMGASIGTFAAPALDTVYRNQLGILQSGELARATTAYGTTTYRLASRGATSGLRGIVAKDPVGGRWYWLDYRNRTGRDAGTFGGSGYTFTGGPEFPVGLAIEIGASDGTTQLLDHKVGSTWRAAFGPGETWRTGGLTVKVGSPSNGTLPVTVTRLGRFSAPTPRISGTMRAGKTLTAIVGTWSPKPSSYSYRWYNGSSAISGATGKTFRIPSSLRGKRITVKVTGKRTGYSTLSKYSASRTVAR